MRNLGTGTVIIQNTFDKSTIEQVHTKFSKQSLNVPWYTENIACRAELGRYPLNIEINASIFSYWQRLKHSTNNILIREAFQYATKLSLKFNRMKKSIKSVKYKKQRPNKHQECTISY